MADLTDEGRKHMMRMLNEQGTRETNSVWGELAKVQPIPEGTFNLEGLAKALDGIQASHGREPCIPCQRPS